MNKEPRTMQMADAAAAARAPENTPAMVKKIGKTTYKVHVHFSNTSTETMSDKIKRIPVMPILEATLLAVGACLLATAIPLRKISKMNIVDSIETVE